MEEYRTKNMYEKSSADLIPNAAPEITYESAEMNFRQPKSLERMLELMK